MTITTVLVIMAAVVVLFTLGGFALGVTIDDKSRKLGGLTGLLLGGYAAFWVGVVLVVLHFIGRVW